MFFVLFTYPSFLFYFDKHRHWQMKYGRFAASSAQKSTIDSSSCRITCDGQRVSKLLIWEAYSPFALCRENLLVRGPVSIFYRSSDFISDSMRSLRTVSLQRWGWKWVAVVSYLNDLFDSYVQEQLTLSLFIVISAGPGKERTPNGQVSKWEGPGTGDREQGAGGSMTECSDSLYRSDH